MHIYVPHLYGLVPYLSKKLSKLIYKYAQDLALNTLQGLICRKTINQFINIAIRRR